MSEGTTTSTKQTTAPESTANNELRLRRGCDCGQHTPGGHECGGCKEKATTPRRIGTPPRTASDAERGVDLSQLPSRTTTPSPEGHDTTAERSAPTPEPPGRAGASVALIADDTDAGPLPGQLRKTDFLERLESAVRAEADAALADTERSTTGCPHLAFWFAYYRSRSSGHVEAALRRYAPETRDARTATEYIPVVAARVRQGVARWARTGEVTGVPAESPHSSAATGGGSTTQDAGGRAADDPVAVRSRLGPGQSLDSRTRSRMEGAFGRSFAHVRTHNDATAHRLSSEQNARAFTVGEHIAFGANEYRPGTVLGDALVAHELAHVAQQSSDREADHTSTAGDHGHESLEDAADQSAANAVYSLWRDTTSTGHRVPRTSRPQPRPGLRLQRCRRDQRREATPPAVDGAAAPAAAPTVTIGQVNATNSPPGFQRIPPRVATPVQVTVSGSGPVELTSDGGGADNGTVTVNGNATETINGSTTVNVRGVDQTTPGHAGNLRLVARHAGNEVATSNRFSVSAIPQNFGITFNGLITGTSRGIRVNNSWESDSQNTADLNEAERSEQVRYGGGTGVFAGITSGDNSGYLPADNPPTVDSHGTPVSMLTGPGSINAEQVFIYNDRRTGITDSPVMNSGFRITRNCFTNDGGTTFQLTTTKQGTATTARGHSSAAGTGSVSRTQRV